MNKHLWVQNVRNLRILTLTYSCPCPSPLGGPSDPSTNISSYVVYFTCYTELLLCFKNVGFKLPQVKYLKKVLGLSN